MKHKPFTLDKQPSHRPTRFAERMREELVELIPGDLKDPNLFGLKLFTITNVEVSDDLKNSSIRFSLMGQQKSQKQVDQIESALNKASHFLRKELMKRLTSKITPHLHFKYDPSFDRSDDLSSQFKAIEDERKARDSEE